MTQSDLPEIQITRNLRSTRLRMRVDGQQIKVTAPIFCTHKQIQSFIKQSEAWMIKTWHAQQQRLDSIDRSLPNEITVFNLAAPIQIEYIEQKNNYLFDELQLKLKISQREPERYLRLFVIAYAKQHLPQYLAAIAAETQLNYTQCHVRQPKTRWGSCSAKHDIMLNSGIVLFSEAVVRYLCVHELAHTRHFDHSTRFWSLVAVHDPAYQMHRKTLKASLMPYWWTQH